MKQKGEIKKHLSSYNLYEVPIYLTFFCLDNTSTDCKFQSGVETFQVDAQQHYD